MDIKNKDMIVFKIGISIVALLSIFTFCNGLFVKSFLLDEALFARNIAAFPEGMFISSAAPSAPLYYLTTWAMVQVIGDFDWVYKLLPIFSAILSLYLVYYYLKNKFAKVIVWVCFTLFAFSVTFIHYASNAHPYATDLLFCILLLVLSESLINNFNRTRLILWILFASLALLSSFPAFFFVPAWAAVILVTYWRTPSGKMNYKLFFSFSPVLIIMGCLYLFFYMKMATLHVNMFDYVTYQKFPSSYQPVELFKHFFENTHLMLGYFFWNYQSGIIGIFLSLLGVVYYLKEKKYAILWLLLANGLIVCMANLLHRWPVGPFRVMLFVLPLFIILFAGAFSLIWNIPKTRLSQIVILLAFISVIIPEIWIAKLAFVKITDSEESVRSLRSAIVDEIEDKDYFIVSYSSVPQFRYYFKEYLNRASLHSWDIRGKNSLIEKEIAQVMKEKPGRYWLFFSHFEDDVADFMIQVASQYGTQVKDVVYPGCRTVLFELKSK